MSSGAATRQGQPRRVAAVYVETSALLAWLLGEPSAEEVTAVVDAADRVVTSVLTVVEAARGLLRAEQLGRLSGAQRLDLLGALQRLHPQWTLMELSAEVRQRAVEPFPAEPVRTLDALHLATALAFRRAYPEMSVVSLDRRVKDNAVGMGFDLVEIGG